MFATVLSFVGKELNGTFERRVDSDCESTQTNKLILYGSVCLSE